MPRQALTTIKLIRHVPAVRPPITAELQGHTLIIAVTGELRLGAGSGDLGHCGERGGGAVRQAGGQCRGDTGTAEPGQGSGAPRRARWFLAQQGPRARTVDASQHMWDVGSVAAASPIPRADPTRSRHATPCNHQSTRGQATARPSEDEEEVGGGGWCTVPSHHALILPSPPSISFSRALAWPGSGFTRSPGVTAAATAARGGGGVCAGKEGVISSRPTWELGACRAEPAPSYPP